jgi:hypothetical protein
MLPKSLSIPIQLIGIAPMFTAFSLTGKLPFGEVLIMAAVGWALGVVLQRIVLTTVCTVSFSLKLKPAETMSGELSSALISKQLLFMRPPCFEVEYLLGEYSFKAKTIRYSYDSNIWYVDVGTYPIENESHRDKLLSQYKKQGWQTLVSDFV